MSKQTVRKRDIGRTVVMTSDQFEVEGYPEGSKLILVGFVPPGTGQYDSVKRTPIVMDSRPQVGKPPIFSIREDLITLID